MSKPLKNKLKSASAGHNFDVVLNYTDGSRYLLNMADVIDRGPWTKQLRDREVFESVAVTPHGAIEWSNGFDVAPEYIRQHARPL